MSLQSAGGHRSGDHPAGTRGGLLHQPSLGSVRPEIRGVHPVRTGTAAQHPPAAARHRDHTACGRRARSGPRPAPDHFAARRHRASGRRQPPAEPGPGVTAPPVPVPLTAPPAPDYAVPQKFRAIPDTDAAPRDQRPGPARPHGGRPGRTLRVGASIAPVPDDVPDSLLNPANSAAADTEAAIATGLDSVGINASHSDKIAGLTIAGVEPLPTAVPEPGGGRSRRSWPQDPATLQQVQQDNGTRLAVANGGRPLAGHSREVLGMTLRHNGSAPGRGGITSGRGGPGMSSMPRRGCRRTPGDRSPRTADPSRKCRHWQEWVVRYRPYSYRGSPPITMLHEAIRLSGIAARRRSAVRTRAGGDSGV